MKEILLVLGGVVATVLVEIVVLVVIAVRRVLKNGADSGQNSREPIKETVVAVLGKE